MRNKSQLTLANFFSHTLVLVFNFLYWLCFLIKKRFPFTSLVCNCLVSGIRHLVCNCLVLQRIVRDTKIWGFIKSIDHWPTNHQPTDHRPLTRQPTDWPTDHRPTDPAAQISPNLKTRFYFKDSIIKKIFILQKMNTAGKM